MDIGRYIGVVNEHLSTAATGIIFFQTFFISLNQNSRLNSLTLNVVEENIDNCEACTFFRPRG